MKNHHHRTFAVIALLGTAQFLVSCTATPTSTTQYVGRIFSAKAPEDPVHIYKTANHIPMRVKWIPIGEIWNYGSIFRLKETGREMGADGVIVSGRHGNATAVRYKAIAKLPDNSHRISRYGRMASIR